MAQVLLVINCQLDASYQNRMVLQALYGERFGDVAFVVNRSCATDENYTNIISDWQPAPLGPDNRCLCCNPAPRPHALGVHTFHPRLQHVADRADDYEFVVFIEDDCVLSPRVTPDWVQQRCAHHDALLPGIWFCDPADTSWVWTRYANHYSNLEAVKNYFDGFRLRDHWRSFSGATLPLQPGVPMFAGFADFFIVRTSLLRKLIGDLQVMEPLWHEIAIPTTILHHTSRINLVKGLALWGNDRKRSLEELTALLHGADWLHPIKLSRYSPSRILEAYRAITLAAV